MPHQIPDAVQARRFVELNKDHNPFFPEGLLFDGKCPSLTSNVESYHVIITQHAASCTCPAWGYNPYKACKHITLIQQAMLHAGGV